MLGGVVKQGFAQASHRLRGQAQRTVGVTTQQTTVAHRLVQAGEHVGGHGRLLTELTFDRIEVDVGVVIAQLLGQGIQLGEILHGPGAITESHPLLTGEFLGTGPVQVGAQTLQAAGEFTQQVLQLRRPEGLGGEFHQFLPLLLGHGVEHALGGGGAGGQGVDELVDIAGILREVLTVFGHEVREVGRGVGTLTVLGQQAVEVTQHLGDSGAVLIGGTLHSLFHAGELLIQHFPAEQILDLFELLSRLGGLPVIGVEFGDRSRGGLGKIVQQQLPEGAVGVIHHHVTGELTALGQHRLVEQFLRLAQRAAEVVALQQLTASFSGTAGEFIKTLPPARTPAQVFAQGLLGGVPGHDIPTDGIQGLGEIHRGRQWIRPTGVAAVAGAPVVACHGGLLRSLCSVGRGWFSRRWFRPRRNPWRSSGRGTGPRVPARWRRRGCRGWWHRRCRRPCHRDQTRPVRAGRRETPRR